MIEIKKKGVKKIFPTTVPSVPATRTSTAKAAVAQSSRRTAAITANQSTPMTAAHVDVTCNRIRKRVTAADSVAL